MTKLNFHIPLRLPSRRPAGENEAAQFGRDPRRDWRLVFIAFLAGNVLSVAFHVLFYERISRGELFLVEKEEPVTLRVLNRAELEGVVAHFEGKRARFEALRKTPLRVNDPYTPPPSQPKAAQQ